MNAPALTHRPIMNLKAQVRQALAELLDWNRAAGDRRAAWGTAWAQEQQQSLQARSSDVLEQLQERAICRGCGHEHSCVGCPVFEIAMHRNTQQFHAAQARAAAGAGCGLLDLSQRALDYAYGVDAGAIGPNKEGPATMAVAGSPKDGAPTSFAAYPSSAARIPASVVGSGELVGDAGRPFVAADPPAVPCHRCGRMPVLFPPYLVNPMTGTTGNWMASCCMVCCVDHDEWTEAPTKPAAVAKWNEFQAHADPAQHSSSSQA